MAKTIFTPGQRKAVSWLIGAILSTGCFIFSVTQVEQGATKPDMIVDSFDLLLKFLYISMGLLIAGNAAEYIGRRREVS